MNPMVTQPPKTPAPVVTAISPAKGKNSRLLMTPRSSVQLRRALQAVPGVVFEDPAVRLLFHAASRASMRFIACTNTEKSALALRHTVGRHISRVRILHQQNRAAVEEADVVVLGVKPYYVKDVLHEPGVREALAGKLVISLVAGLSAKELQSLIVSPTQISDAATPYVARAIPNVATRYGQSMTIVEKSDPRSLHSRKVYWRWYSTLLAKSRP
ncbi:Pyrroline-5-carboxylate reductase, catalytic, N-terminal [Fusarium oxysporum f. sp. vasinfectum]|nr:Pyrroline-5-carboxylate reductase, catalytic, N-terminal [Fusarium oxysporum f. sp. vasinfectum]